MKSFETARTWLIIIALLLFSGIASLIWVAVDGDVSIGGIDLSLDRLTGGVAGGVGTEETEMITIQLDQYLLGEVLVDIPGLNQLNGVEVHPLVLAGILTAVFVGGLIAIGLPLAFIYVRLERQTEQIKEDPEFQEKVSNLEKQQKDALRELSQVHPPDPIPEHRMYRWDRISTSLIILFFVIVTGFALADSFYTGGDIVLAEGVLLNPAIPIAGALGLLTLIILFFVFRRQPTEEGEVEAVIAASDNAAIPWGTIWVIVSGLIFMGIGMGLMFAIRAAGP